MRANSPSSIVVSLIIHGFIAAVIFVTTVYVAQQDKAPPVIFELVAGPPTAPDELVAPALGNTTSPVKLDVPTVQLPPEPPVTDTVQTNEPEVKETAPTTVAPPTTPAVKPTTKPKPDTSISKQMKQSEKTSYKDYLKKHPVPKPAQVASASTAKAGSVPRIDAQGIANGVRGGSTANVRGGGGGKALTREEQSEFNTYISFLLNALKAAHDPPPGTSDQLAAEVTFDITASGSILNPRISKSSGDRAFDESVLQAFRRVKPIGPPPDGKSDTWKVTFRMKDLE
jgi:colicin import membrane protein